MRSPLHRVACALLQVPNAPVFHPHQPFPTVKVNPLLQVMRPNLESAYTLFFLLFHHFQSINPSFQLWQELDQLPTSSTNGPSISHSLNCNSCLLTGLPVPALYRPCTVHPPQAARGILSNIKSKFKSFVQNSQITSHLSHNVMIHTHPWLTLLWWSHWFFS